MTTPVSGGLADYLASKWAEFIGAKSLAREYHSSLMTMAECIKTGWAALPVSPEVSPS